MSRTSLDKWNEAIGKIQEKLAIAEEHKSMKNALNAMLDLRSLPIQEIFGVDNEKYTFSEDYQEEIKNLNEEGIRYVTENYADWIERQTCLSISDMNQFENKGKRYCDSFKRLGLDKYISPTRQHFENELANKEKIKSRQELREDCEKFLKETEITKYTSYTTLIEWTKKGQDLGKRLEKYSYALGEDAVRIADEVKSRTRVVSSTKDRITAEITAIWDDLSKITRPAEIEDYVKHLWDVLQKGLPQADKEGIEELYNNMLEIRKDILALQKNDLSRDEMIQLSEEMHKKYENIEYDFDALEIMDKIINSQTANMNMQEETWNKSYGTLGDKSTNHILWWKDKIKSLPSYLSENSIKNIEKLKIEAEEILSKNRVEEVLFCFDKLTLEEKKNCLEELKKKVE